MRSALWFGIVVVAAACGGKKDAPPPGAGSAAPVVAAPAPADAAAAPRVAPKLDTAAIQQVVDAWLAAQNGGDFAAYSALYAEKFGGIKRVGPRAWTFDRAGWLKDRSRMFKAPMQVSISDITITGSPAVASVLITQRYTQGAFSDRGEKQLVIVKDGAGYKIAREEMLRSEVGRDASAPALARHLVTEVDGAALVILGPATTEEHGPIEGPFTTDDRMLATARVTGAAAAAKQQLALFAADGTSCIGDVSGRILVSGGTPHFGTVQEWNGGFDDADIEPLTPRARAEAVFAMTTPYVAAHVANGAGDCTGVLAVPTGTAVTAFPPAPDAALEAAALAAYRKDARWKAIQAEWKGTYSGSGPWESSATARTFSGAGRTFVVVSGKEGAGCGEFEGALALVFEAKGGKPTVLAAHGDLDVTAIFDTDGDGEIELVVDDLDWSSPVGLLELDGDSLTPAETVTFPFQDCGC